MITQFTFSGGSSRVETSSKEFVLDSLNEQNIVIINGDITTNGDKTIKVIVTASNDSITRLIKRSSVIASDYGIKTFHSQVSGQVVDNQQSEIELAKKVTKLAQTLCNTANSHEVPLASSSTPDRAQYILAASQLIASRLY